VFISPKKKNSRQSNHYTGFKEIKKLKQSNFQHGDILSNQNTLYPLRRRKPMNVQNKRHLNTQNGVFFLKKKKNPKQRYLFIIGIIIVNEKEQKIKANLGK
jgi:hypothetical protein